MSEIPMRTKCHHENEAEKHIVNNGVTHDSVQAGILSCTEAVTHERGHALAEAYREKYGEHIYLICDSVGSDCVGAIDTDIVVEHYIRNAEHDGDQSTGDSDLDDAAHGYLSSAH